MFIIVLYVYDICVGVGVDICYGCGVVEGKFYIVFVRVLVVCMVDDDVCV